MTPPGPPRTGHARRIPAVRRRPRRAARAAAAALLAVCAAVSSLPAAGQGGPGGGEVPAEGALPPPRIAGGDRVATAEALAGRWAATGRRAEVAVVVPAGRTGVALAAAGLAGSAGGVVVLSDDPPRPSTVAAVRATGAGRVLVAGGGSLAAAWAAAGLDAEGVPGADDGTPAIAAALARRLLAAGGAPGEGGAPEGGAAAFLVGTGGLPDAVAVSPLAWRAGAPVLLTAAAVLDPHVAALVREGLIGRVTVVGGTAAVGQAVEDELRRLGAAVTRVAGADREQTALAVAAMPASDPTAGQGPAPGGGLEEALDRGAVIAAGDDPADAAAGGAYAAASGRPVLPPGPQVAWALAERCGDVGALTVLGGAAAVPAAAEDDLRRAAQRCDGPREPMVLRLGVAAPAPEQGPQIAALATGAAGWGSRRVRIAITGEDAAAGLLVAAPGACGSAAMCRSGRTVVLDGARWGAADAADRSRLVGHAVGHLLGEPVAAGCDGSVMAPLSCPPGEGAVHEGARQAVADRYVPTARLAFAGDVHAERQIAAALAQGRNPLAPVAAHLSGADLAILNLETPLSTRGAPVPKTYTFRGPPAMAGALAAAGVDVVSLANNHALDYGVDALLDTLVHTGAAGVAAVGAGGDAAAAYAPHVAETPAGRVAVVGLTRVLHTRAWEAGPGRPGLASAYDEAQAVAAVAAAREVADHVVVAVHWGTERADCPDAAQRRLAVLLGDAGADLVIGHHPHVLQGVQVRDGALIAYSLGNFAWYHDQAPSRFTGILDVELPLLDDPVWGFAPAQIGPDGSPHPVDGPLGAAISARLADRSPGGAVGCAFP